MGSYASLYIGTLEIDSDKNDINPFVLSVFQESDKRITTVTRDDKELFSKYYELEEDEIPSFNIIQLSCKVAVARDRLNLLGFTKEVAEKGFQLGLKVELQRIEDRQEKYSESQFAETIGDIFTEQLEILKSLTLEAWIKTLPEVLKLKHKGISVYDSNFHDYSPLVKYMLKDERFGFPSGNFNEYRHFLRLILEFFDENEELIYDLTDLVYSDWISERNLINYVDEEISPAYEVTRRIIVITEGSTDTMILERSLKLLYPHLADYFRFLDFKGTNIAGGASALAHTVKAFAGVGIVNRIIALFDNDTGAEDALRSLTGVPLPSNIIILRYPEIEIAKNYPTLGPTGIAKMDVNGLAGSIELYLGDDILIKEDGSQIPVQWKGFVQSVQKYQGEIISKAEVQSKFIEKIKICENDPSLIDKFDWSGIRAIIDEMLRAFNKKDEEEILKTISKPFDSEEI